MIYWFQVVKEFYEFKITLSNDGFDTKTNNSVKIITVNFLRY